MPRGSLNSFLSTSLLIKEIEVGGSLSLQHRQINKEGTGSWSNGEADAAPDFITLINCASL